MKIRLRHAEYGMEAQIHIKDIGVTFEWPGGDHTTILLISGKFDLYSREFFLSEESHEKVKVIAQKRDEEGWTNVLVELSRQLSQTVGERFPPHS